MSSTIQKRIERSFFVWVKDLGDKKGTLYGAYLAGCMWGLERSRDIMEEAIEERDKKEVYGSQED
jgi:hypothetical protein